MPTPCRVLLLFATTTLLVFSPFAIGGELPAIPPQIAENEPPTNPFLARSHWPMCHRNTYNQASSPYPGPTGPSNAQPNFVKGHPVPVTLAISSPYPNGERVVWGVTKRNIFKLDL